MGLRRTEVIPAAVKIENGARRRRRARRARPFEPLATQRRIARPILLAQMPAGRHLGRPQPGCGVLARPFDADMRLEWFGPDLSAQEPARDGTLPTHRGALPERC